MVISTSIPLPPPQIHHVFTLAQRKKLSLIKSKYMLHITNFEDRSIQKQNTETKDKVAQFSSHCDII